MTTGDDLAEVVRVEGGRMLAVLARSLGDLQLAEDAVQDASVAALEVWGRSGLPSNPSGWLYVAARRKALDVIRREARRSDRERAATERGELLAPAPPTDLTIADDMLRLVFTCCHPALDLDTRVALALRTLCGLSTAEVARALLVSEATMAKRLTRARRKIAAAAIGYRVPGAGELPDRLPGVCAVVHLVYTTGHHGDGEDVVRADLCAEGLRLARLVDRQLPDQPAVLGLLALLALTEGRGAGRVDETGDVVLLADQDRSRWDRALLSEGARALDRSLVLTGGVADPYQLQAAIAAVHAAASTYDDTDWAEVLRLYRLLGAVHPNPVVDLNAAVARAEVDGPAEALAELDAVAGAARSHHWHAARGEMFLRLGRPEEAVRAFDAALLDVPAGPGGPERRHLSRRRTVAEGG